MALLFMDGFDHYATADITKKYTSTAVATIAASSGRRSGGCLSGGTGVKVVKTIPATTSFVIGFAFNASVAPGGNRTLFVLADAGTNQCNLILNNDLTLSVARNSVVLTGGTSVSALTTGTWNYIEWKVTIADSISAGSCVLKVNGTTWVTVTTGQDTKNTTNTTATQTWFGDTSTITGTWLFDDFYVCDQSGSTNNDFLGDCRIDMLLPNGDGNYTSFTPSTGSSHYQLVDEATPNTSDYNQSNTTSQKDSYQMQNLTSSTGTIYGVQAIAAVMKDDAGSRLVKVGVRSSSTDSLSSVAAPSTSQLFVSNIHETDPATSAAWTDTAVNNAEFLVECD